VLDLLPQYLFNGILVGSSYALIAIGLTAIFGLMNIANFAHGQFYMLGGFVGYLLTTAVGMPFWLALIASALIVAAIGFLLERLIFYRLRGTSLLSSVMVTIGLSIVLENLALLVWGPRPERIPSGMPSTSIEFWGIFATPGRLAVVGITVTLVVLLQLGLHYTLIGKQIRATFQQREAAQLVGIDIGRLYSLTFACGAGLAATAGVMLGSIFVVHPNMGGLATLKAFIVVILGGIGNFPGAIAGGLILGVAENLGSVVSSAYKDAAGFLLVILILLFKPAGLFGRHP
jgi:branched-chain amino acid transport system permease protein